MGVIRVLASEVADQIAAGEVVERPASVVKELVENALDAGARNVEVSVDGGGVERIRVVDDGGGMAADDAVLCFSRHATSKLTQADELRRLGTFGFRGEALAAIASVARVRLVTRRAGDEMASEVRVQGGRVVHVGSAGGVEGTRIEVDDLFFNTPARRKFLKALRTEAGHVEDALADAALCLPGVGFRLVVDGKLALDLPRAPDDAALAHAARVDRAVRCLGKHVRPMLFPLEARTELLGISGYVVAPLETRRDLTGIHLSVNRRPVSDRGLVQAVRTAFRTLLEVGRQPIVALDVQIDPELVDVNVHPRKAEVRFAEPRRVTGHIIALLSDFLATTPWLKSSTSPIRPRVMVLGETRAPFAGAPPSSLAAMATAASTSAASTSAASTNAGASAIATGIASDTATGTATDIAPGTTRSVGFGDVYGTRIRDSVRRLDDARGPTLSDALARVPAAARVWRPSSSAQRDAFLNGPPNATSGARPLALVPVAGTGGASSFAALRVVGQVGGMFLVLEAPEGMVVIDQHAAHERVVFERLRAARAAATAPSQPLLIPLQLELSLTEMSALEDKDARALLDKHGLVIEPFGARAALVKALPPGLDGKKAEQIARDALAELAHGANVTPRLAAGGSTRDGDGSDVLSSAALDDRMDRVCARLACHAAIRAGDVMHADSVRALLRELDAIDLGAHCPHGRPVVRTVTFDEMAIWFDRK